MNYTDIIIGILAAALVIFTVIRAFVRKKNKKSGCAGCSGCQYASECSIADKRQDEENQ